MIITAQEGQSIFDICLQEFGSLEPLIARLLADNDELTVTGKITTGRELVINKTGVGDQDVRNFVVLQGITMSNDQGTGQPAETDGDFSNDFSNDFR